MTVGELRKALEGVADDVVVVVDEYVGSCVRPAMTAERFDGATFPGCLTKDVQGEAVFFITSEDLLK